MTNATNRAVAAFDRGDYATALQEWLKAAQQGDASAQNNVATLYASGQGVARDLGEALKWWRRAAEQGFVDAVYAIGNFYAHGQGGLPQNKRDAATYWRKAAE